MKTRSLILAVTAAVVLSALGGVLCAQQPRRSNIRQPAYRPPVSPYLNLLNRNNNSGRFGGGAAFDYYQRVRPQLEFRAANQRLGQSVNVLNQRTQEIQRRAREFQGGLGQTGRPARFMDYGGYFPGLGRRN